MAPTDPEIEATDGVVWVTPAPAAGFLAQAEAIERLRIGLSAAAESVGCDADIVAGGKSLLALGLTARALDAFRLQPAGELPRERQRHVFEVRYDGPDLETAASALGLRPEALVRRHQAGSYTALLTGFLPGFAYLGGLDETLALPRLPKPRARVPVGAVAIAGLLTAAYPFASPGGWNLIGRLSPELLFDVQRRPLSTIHALDEVRFVERETPWPEPSAARVSPSRSQGALMIEAVVGLATIQDLGRFGQRAEAVPWSGPLDEETHVAANLAVGNDSHAAAIELVGGKLSFVAAKRLSVSIDGSAARTLRSGERLSVSVGDKLTRTIAIAGGVEVPLVLGSRSTLLLAGLGGFDGRPLRVGDWLEVGHEIVAAPLSTKPPATSDRSRVAVLCVERARNDTRLSSDAFERLLDAHVTISAARDRVGTRFDGDRLPARQADDALPEPVVVGSIQVTTDGTLIALGPDSAVTGGYPVVAVLDRASRSLLGRLRPGQAVRFRAA